MSLERDEHGVLPAMNALYRGDLEEAQRLTPPDEELSAAEAAALGRIERLRALIDEDPSAANDWTPDGFGALAMAAYGGHEDAARLLIEHGADLLSGQRLAHARVQAVRQRGGVSLPCRFGAEVGELLALEQVVPEGNARGHQPMVALAHRGALRG